jgi:tetratricopeptide (TPR) repeat protein
MIDPFLIQGAATLSRGQPDVAEGLFREARRRDPRSAAARYFLAQYYLTAGRPVEGLAEASVLTRLVPGASTALIPGLVQYARAPGAVTNLRKIFAANPTLGNQVMAELARDASNADLLISLAGKDFDLNRAAVPAWQTELLRSLIERGDYAKAKSLWREISGLRAGSPGLFNPQFAKIAAPVPFNWSLGSGKFGVAEPASGKLQVIYYGRDDGQFASQLLLLAPGTYQLRMQVVREDPRKEPSSLAWTVTCQPGAKQLLSLALTKAEIRTGALASLFTVPPNCPSQQLVLSGTSREFAESEQVMISNLQLVGGVR